MYTIKSTSEEGVYFLVNGWEKHKTFWKSKSDIRPSMLFKRPQDARSSLTKLLKVMPEYNDDVFELVTL